MAATFPMEFSGGGTTPLAKAGRDGTQLSLGWPGQLPKPVLKGGVAVYPEVLKGVDLEVKAELDAFSYALVVKDRESAKNPALRKLSLTTKTKGLSLGVDAKTGAIGARDASGRLVLGGATPIMGDADTEKPVKAEIRAGALDLVPDPVLLDDPGARFPIRIDASFAGRRNHWTVVRTTFPNTSYYDRLTLNEPEDATQGVLRVGKSGSQIARSFVEFNIAAVAGTVVSKATFSVWHSWTGKDCGNGNNVAGSVAAWHTGGINGSTTWDAQPGWIQSYGDDDKIVRRHTGGSGSKCPAGAQEYTVTTPVTAAAANGAPNLTLGLQAVNEGDVWSWKRYKVVGDSYNAHNPFLAIDYNSYPTAPDQLTVSGRPCVTGASRPWLDTRTPVLKARLTDPEPETDMKATFEWARVNADGSYSPVVGSATTPGNTSSGTTTQIATPALDEGGLYAFRALANDGSLNSKAHSAWCEFGVDTVGLDTAPEVASADYPADDAYHGAPGQTGTFTFSGGGADATGFKYGWADPPTTHVAGAPSTLQITPPPPSATDPTRPGQLTLYVRAVDRAGHESPIKRHTILIGSAGGPVGDWALDGPGTEQTDSAPAKRTARLSGGTPGADGRLVGVTAVSFDGVDDYAATTGPVVDTSKSFTVSAWVKLADKTAWRTVVSQAGETYSTFRLEYNSTADRWQMAALSNNEGGAAVSTAAPVAGVWTHLAGVYDAGARTVTLYVNGVAQQTVARPPAPWTSVGALSFGRSLWAGAFKNYFSGSLSGVKVWNRVLASAEITGQATTRVGLWTLDGHGGDDSGYGRDAQPTGASWTADRGGNADAAAGLNGSAKLATSGPVLHTDQPFTVAAWVRITDLSRYERTAVAQEGTNVASFYLGLRQDLNRPQWSMQLRPGDTDACCPWAAVGGTVKLNQWQHLAGVYDRGAAKVRLYVDGVKVAEVASGAAWRATGPLSIGFGKWMWAGDFFMGDLDDVHAYAGVLPDSRIAALAAAAPGGQK
ncbi:LamG-like jellyroll fold domain-containing protein [Rhizohabitans arisaemae]|uniref:LamG-like jellyroll fold domain-containing protein n=1 Tax=Rhizohabitans arisaemae TaxID=2720610 RepID=UPI0024B1AA5A|nr:LamG-like jellyroll fold domain-containing protein [Rhizohabitans arisaemae]